MKITQICYETEYRSFDLDLSDDEAIVFVISRFQSERDFFVSSIEKAIYGTSGNEYEGLIEKSAISFDNGSKYSFPESRAQKQPAPFTQESFRAHVLGDNPFDAPENDLQNKIYKKSFENYLAQLSGGRMTGLRWDREKGLLLEQGNFGVRLIQETSRGEYEQIRLAAMMSDIVTGRFQLQIITTRSLDLLEEIVARRLFKELAEITNENVQIFVVCTLRNVLGFPSGFRSPLVHDLDALESFGKDAGHDEERS